MNIYKTVAACTLLLTTACATTNKIQVADRTDSTTESVVVADIENRGKSVATKRVIKRAAEASPIVSRVDIKKISASFKQGDNKRSFRASMKMIHDSLLLLSAYKMSIPVLKSKLDRDSISIILYTEKEFITTDWSLIKEELGLDVSLLDLQAILTGRTLTEAYVERDKKILNYKTVETDGEYILYSIKKRRLSKVLDNEQKRERYTERRKNNRGGSVIEKIFVNKESFKTQKIVLEDIESNSTTTILYKYSSGSIDQTLPQGVHITHINSDSYETSIDLSYSKYSVETPFTTRFKIPSKYKRRDINQ